MGSRKKQTEDNTKEKDNKLSESARMTIIVAIIGLLGTLGAAYLSYLSTRQSSEVTTPAPLPSTTPIQVNPGTDTATVSVIETYTPQAIATSFSDNFDEKNSAWSGDVSSFDISSGKAIFRDVPKALLTTGELSWSDYTIELSAEGINPDEMIAGNPQYNSYTYFVGVVVRYHDPNNYIEFVLNCDNQGSSYWQVVKNGVIEPEKLTQEEYLYCFASHRIKVEVRGNQYKAYIDDKPRRDFSDNIFSTGMVGIATTKTSDDGFLAIDYFTVQP